MNRIEIDFERCDGCKTCYKACFVDVLRWDEVKKLPIVAYPEDCVQCNLCELYCPKQVVRVIVDWDKPFPSALEHDSSHRI
jgi:NAD-dependent dihydropyrimidine dehydrogenase PreA subunit